MALRRSAVRRLRLFDFEQVLHQLEGQEWVPHWHEEWSFGAIVAGRCRCSVGGRPLTSRTGDLIAIAPGDVHTGALLATEHREPVLAVMFYVPAAWLGWQQLDVPARSGRVRAPGLARDARRLDTADEATAWLRRAVPVLHDSLRARGAGDTAPRPSDAEFLLLRRLQAAVLAGERTVSGLADRCQVSRERIHRVVTRRLGLSPRDYLRTVRLHLAKSRLMAGEPIAAVAAECGFADQAHFTRWFRRTFGYTPGDLLGARTAGSP